MCDVPRGLSYYASVIFRDFLVLRFSNLLEKVLESPGKVLEFYFQLRMGPLCIKPESTLDATGYL